MFIWTTEHRKLSELKPYDKNPRTLTQTQAMQLSDSLDRFGLIDKPVINLDGTIIGGHQRIELYAQKGATEIEVWVPDAELSEKEVEELNIRLNRNGGEWDYDCLGNGFEITDLLQWGFLEEDLGLGKQEKPKKAPKPTVTFEFSSPDELLEYLPRCEEIASECCCKMSVKT